MSASDLEPACVVRGMLGEHGEVRLVTRNLSLAAQGQTSYPPEATRPSALDLLVASLAVDVLAGFTREAEREGVAIDDAELQLSARLDHPLVALGVVGETGTCAIGSLRGSLYVSGDAPIETLDPLLRRALERAPVYATLRRSAAITLTLKLV